MAAQSRQRPRPFLQSSEFGPPTPSPAGECVPPPFGSGGTHLLAGEGVGGVPILDEGADVLCDLQYMYIVGLNLFSYSVHILSGGACVRFPDDAVQYLAFGEKYWDVMYTLYPST